jgi:4-hydroxy-tetrahydrodipicolinate synthase
MTPNSNPIQTMFNGSIAALVTPFTDLGEIDYTALDGLVDFHLENGTDGLVIAGTTGESATLTRDEFAAVLKRVLGQVAGRMPVVAGTGSASTASAIMQTRLACELGADAALVVTPYYNRPTQAGLLSHFTAVADESSIPLLLYNVPSRTAVDMLPATVAQLADHPRILGIKEAVGDPKRFVELMETCGDGFVVLSGDDHSCLKAMKQGAAGVVSVAANAAPGQMHQLCRAAQRQDWTVAERIDSGLQPLFGLLMIETNPIPVKWALFEMGLITSRIRLPLTELDEMHRATLRQCLVRQGLIQA